MDAMKNFIYNKSLKRKVFFAIVLITAATCVFLYVFDTPPSLTFLHGKPSLIWSGSWGVKDSDPSAGTFERTNCKDKNGKYVNSSLSCPIWEVLSPPVTDECLQNLPKEPDFTKDFPEEDIAFLDTEEGKEYKKILVWNYAYGSTAFSFGYRQEPFKKACCKESRCFLSGNRTRMPVTDFDAILFHFRSTRQYDLPLERHNSQRWVFFEKESAIYSEQPVSRFNGMFNWTMTNRRDSDIYVGYGYIYPKEVIWGNNKKLVARDVPKNLTYNAKGQKVIAAWFVSNCKTSSHRELYVKQLQQFIGVDIYGKCGTLKCTRNTFVQCYEMMEKKYKFYLSFENSLCKDYTTEKFFNVLNYDVVPVVYGLGDYRFVVPEHSYINVFDFQSIEELANYLNYLDRNNTAYREYFRWKEDYVLYSSSINQWFVDSFKMCSLCQRLHADSSKKIYHDLGKWFMKGSQCRKGVKPRTKK